MGTAKVIRIKLAYCILSRGSPVYDMFPDSTLCGNAELGDNNQVQVALVIYLCLARGI